MKQYIESLSEEKKQVLLLEIRQFWKLMCHYTPDSVVSPEVKSKKFEDLNESEQLSIMEFFRLLNHLKSAI